MTRGNAYQYLKKVYLTTKNDSYREALSVALSALRPVSRDQVWRGEWIDTNHRTSSCKCTKCGAVQEYETPFCPACGAPMTDKAVETIMKRMEEMRND